MKIFEFRFRRSVTPPSQASSFQQAHPAYSSSLFGASEPLRTQLLADGCDGQYATLTCGLLMYFFNGR